MTTPSSSKFRAESHRDPHWIALRLIGNDAKAQGGKNEFWAWLIPPEASLGMRAAMGALAWGRFPWEDALALSIAHGLCASYYCSYENSEHERMAMDRVKVDSQDASKPPEYTKHSFDPLLGRASTNTPAIAWATIKINIPLEGHRPDSQGLLAELDSIMKSAHPDCVLIGPRSIPARNGQLPHCGGDELAALVEEARAAHERSRLDSSTTSGTPGAHPKSI